MKTQCRCGHVFDDEGKDIKTTMQMYSNGINHKKALCPNCGIRQPRALPQTQFVEVLYFGKYKGRRIDDIAKEDPGYLQWTLENMDLSGRMRMSIETALHDTKEAF